MSPVNPWDTSESVLKSPLHGVHEALDTPPRIGGIEAKSELEVRHTEFHQKENGSIRNTNQKRKDGWVNTIRILTEGEGGQGSIQYEMMYSSPMCIRFEE